ncbi:cation:H+ antiporter [Spiroplasma syrphidicola EA-1]|uniref:Cation:H+ antiporter n=1 Tax=Spiroplasma syrphidicola EA-1 TaxID=1276229 RepID=R4UL53_9MOLU|nr:cation:H+ antiporter [Spiroplasma syrphidicola]AGM25986.1 cation:H+ antiporter [Spiroplasma syrphidicola EA-1]
MIYAWNVDLFKKMGLYDGPIAQGLVWLIFLLLAGGVIFSAIKMAGFLVAFTARKNIGQSLAGGLILAIITSLPELTIAFTMGASNTPQFSFGNTLGANSFFMTIFALGSLIFLKKHKFNKINKFYSNLLFEFAFFSALILLAFLPNLLYPNNKVLIPFLSLTIPGIEMSWLLISIAIIYFTVITISIVKEKNKTKNNLTLEFEITDDLISEKDYKNHLTIKKITCLFILFTILLVFLAFSLSLTADILPHVYGIPETSVGGIILSFVTNCPELTSTFVLLKNNKKKIAFGGLIGSLNFNLVINFFADLAFRQNGSLNHIIYNNPYYLQYSILTILQFILMFFTFSTTTKAVQTNKKWYISINVLIILTYIIVWTLILTIVPVR